MELHTLGVNGGYTQKDVVEVARAFTGWTIFDPNRVGEFDFNPAMHDRGEKVVLGQTIPRAGGESDGLRVLEILARHPSTAQFIARKLSQRFVADDPPKELVDRVAATFQKTNGDLRAVMETLLLSREFLSEGAFQAKTKSPLELVVSSLRAFNAEMTDTTARGAAAHRAGPAAVRQVGADRLSEHGRAVDELGRPAGAHELRHGADGRPDHRRQHQDGHAAGQ